MGSSKKHLKLMNDINSLLIKYKQIFIKRNQNTKDEIDKVKRDFKDYSFVTTQKDFVKLKDFNLENLYLMNLDLIIDDEKLKDIDNYIQSYKIS